MQSRDGLVLSNDISIKRIDTKKRDPSRFQSHSHALSPAEFSIWTREAGAGGLSIAVEGPSRAEISFDDRKDGSCGVSYIAQEPGRENADAVYSDGCSSMSLSHSLSYILSSSSPGDYEISVKFNDQHIPDSPFLVPVAAPVNDARRLTVTGLQVRHEETPPHPACPALLKGSGHSCIKT